MKKNKQKRSKQKKVILIIISILLLILLSIILLFSFSHRYVTITFDTDGGNIIETQKIKRNEHIKKLPTPIKDGHTFEYWIYNNKKYEYDKITTNIVLKAKWKKNIIEDNKQDISNNTTSNVETKPNNKIEKPQNSKPQNSKPNNNTSNNNINNNQNTNNNDKDIETTVIAAKKAYFCDVGYTLNTIYCERILETTPTKEYTCPDGMTKIGQYCQASNKVSLVDETNNYISKNKTSDIFKDKTETEIKEIACKKNNGTFSESDYLQNNNMWCYKYSGIITTGAIPQLVCPSDYALDNEQCIKLDRINAKYSYYCENNYTLKEDKCYK